MTPEGETAAREEIAREILDVQRKAYGTGASNARVTLDDDLVVMVLDVELAKSEQTLLDAGRGDAVKAVRENFQQAIGPTFMAIVERATGRNVISFMSAMSVDPIYQVEVFRLAPNARPAT